MICSEAAAPPTRAKFIITAHCTKHNAAPGVLKVHLAGSLSDRHLL